MHLREDHDMADDQTIEENTEKSRIGRHCDPKFWCGFCVEVVMVKVVENKDEHVNMWTKRCDHIDGHLFGKGGLVMKRREEWQHIEDLKPEQEPEHDDTSSGSDTEAPPGSVSTRPDGQSDSSRSATSAEEISKKRGQSQDDNPQPRKKPNLVGKYAQFWCCVSVALLAHSLPLHRFTCIHIYIYMHKEY
jgi:hypothetical protein